MLEQRRILVFSLYHKKAEHGGHTADDRKRGEVKKDESSYLSELKCTY